MGLFSETRFQERLTFFNGQRLFDQDLQNVVDSQREMRRLHNCSLHQAGVGSGFAVSGQPEEREVEIGPGYALDSNGAEIVLTRSRREPVPPVDADEDGNPAFYDLTVSHPSDEDLEPSQTRQGICLPRGAVRLREEPVFCWVRLERDEAGGLHPRDARLDEQIQKGLKIRLARVEVKSCRIQSLSVAERRNARPPVHPYIACGKAQPQWQVTDRRFEGTDFRFIFISAEIDTASAGFLNPPCYSARLEGSRILNGIDPEGPFFADALISIEQPSKDRFLLRGFVGAHDLGAILFANLDQIPEERWTEIFAPWHVEWMGVE